MTKNILALLLTVIIFCSCGTTRNAVNGRSSMPESFTADLKVSFESDNDSRSVNGTMLVKRDEAVRMQLFIPIIGSELMRTDFKKEGVLLVDRMGHNYIKADYNAISQYSGLKLSFNEIMKFIETKYTELKKGKQKKAKESFDLPLGLTSGGGGKVTIEIFDIKEKAKWDTETKLSSKYKEINAYELMQMLKR